MKDFQDIDSVELVDDWQPELAVPLVNTTISVQDLLDNFETGGYLDVDDENFMSLVYNSHIYSVTGEEMVKIPDFVIPMLDTAMTVPYGMVNTPFDIDYFKAKKGTLNYTYQSMVQEDLDVMIEVVNLTKNGEVLQIPTTAVYTGASPIEVTGEVDLDEYVFLLANDEIEVRYVALDSNGDRQVLPGMVLEFKDFEYSFAQGYFGQYAFDLPKDTIVIDLFKKAISGSVRVQDPKINLTITNSFGLPIQVTAEEMMATTINGEEMHITSPLDDGFDFNYPTLSEVGQAKTSVININNSTSNLADLIEQNPEMIQFELAALSNPTADPDQKGFVKDNSSFDIDLEVEIPVWLSAKEFKIEKTNDLDASFFDEIEEAEFKLYMENGLPVEASVQVYFLDATGNVLGSLFDAATNLIGAAPVDADGKVTGVTTGEQIVMIDSDQIQSFQNATQITISGTVSTADAGNTAVKFYTDHTIDFKLGAKVKKSN